MFAPKLEGLILPACIVVGLVGWGVVEFVLWLLSHISISLV